MLRLIRAHSVLLRLAAEYSAAMCWVCPNLSDLTMASSQYDILLCSETLVSDLRHVTELLVNGLRRPVLLFWGKLPRARGMAAYVRDGYGAFRKPKFECGCCEMMVVRVCGLRQNFYVYRPYRNPDQDDRIYDYLLTLMAGRSYLWVI